MGRRAMTGLTMTLLVALLLTGAVLGWRTLTSPLPGSTASEEPSDGPSCAEGVQPGEVVSSVEVTVSVFNAGSRSGLADQTQGELLARGFIAGDLGNAPATFAGVRYVRVLAPRKDDPAATLVAKQFGPDTLVQVTDNDLGPGVDVIVGDKFRGLVKGPRSIKAAVAGSGC